MDGITVITCYSLMVVGKFDNLESLAHLIASTVQGVQVLVIKYQNGWRLMLICKDNTALSSAYSLVQDRVQQGVTLTIVNGANPMVTRIYSVSS